MPPTDGINVDNQHFSNDLGFCQPSTDATIIIDSPTVIVVKGEVHISRLRNTQVDRVGRSLLSDRESLTHFPVKVYSSAESGLLLVLAGRLLATYYPRIAMETQLALESDPVLVVYRELEFTV
jgi:hypothetical protein